MRKYLLFLFVMALSSCNIDIDSEFFNSAGLSLQVDGRTVLTYEPATWQCSFNRDRGIFRVHTDTMSDYWVVELDRIPASVGQKVRGNIGWTDKSDVVSKEGLTFSVEKMQEDGMLWLWCRREKIAVVVQILE